MAPGVPPARYRLSQIQPRKSRKVRWIRTSIPEIEAIFSDQRTGDRILSPGEHGSKENSLAKLAKACCEIRAFQVRLLEGRPATLSRGPSDCTPFNMVTWGCAPGCNMTRLWRCRSQHRRCEI